MFASDQRDDYSGITSGTAARKHTMP